MAAPKELTHRLFFAFDVDEASRAAVQRLIDELSSRIDPPKAAGKGRVKWVERENLHVTVRFLGSTLEARLGAIRKLLEPRFTSHSFKLRLDKLGAFPERSAPRVIWLGDSAEAPHAETVERELSARLETIGVSAESRRFRAHLTLGRFRETGRREHLRIIGDFVVQPIGPVLIDHITLYESHLSNRGPTYEAILRVPLE